jgi:hypothetical protein
MGASSHDLGIDRLRQMHTTIARLDLLYAFVDEFEYRPTALEVELIGRELRRMTPRLDRICPDHRSLRQERNRNQTPRLRRGPRAGG